MKHYKYTSICTALLLVTLSIQYTATKTEQSAINSQENSHATTNNQAFEELFNHANQLRNEKKYDEAIDLYKQALSLSPNPHAFFNLGTTFHMTKQYKQALLAYTKAIELQNDYPAVYINMSKLLITIKKPEAAIKPLKMALSYDPKSVEAYILLGRAYSGKGLFEKAIKTLMKALNIAPDNDSILSELANAYNITNQLEPALKLYKKLSKRSPKNANLLYNIAHTLKKMGRFEDAFIYYEKTLELQPDHKDAIFSRGLAYLINGDFEKGWSGYEWRYNNPSNGSLRTFPQPRWDGSDLHGKTILIHAEQGLGDTFQFIRYAQQAKNQGATVIAAVQKPLMQLISNCPYIDQVIAQTDTPPAFDVHASTMSMPYICKTMLDTVPNTIPYIFADEERIQHWKEQLSTDQNFKIGICWHANDSYATPALQAIAAQRSIHVSQFAPLWNIPGVTVYSLQRVTGTDQVAELDDNHKLITFDETFDRDHGRFMDTAALVKNLDLVISIDTSMCHCAAALGTPTWTLMPNPCDWRWILGRTDTPWYPNMRLFKQPTIGDWDPVFAEVVALVKQIVEERKHAE